MRVAWTEPARRHLREIYSFIQQSSPVRAQRLADRLTERVEQIGEFPRSGHVIRGMEELEIREIYESAYRIIYVVVRDHVEVLGIVHARSDVL